MRTLVLAAGILLVTALVVFLAVGKWKNPFNRRDLPKRLGLDIQQEANGWTYTHGFRGHTLYKIHASKLVQMKQGNHVLLHDVKIELYGADGSRVDRIEGKEFEYDPDEGTVKASGPVEIALMRPGTAPAIAPRATPGQVAGHNAGGKPLAATAEAAERGEIHVKTSGLTFEQKSGVASSEGRVEFSMAQGNGSSMGAAYDSQKGLLVLDRAVELNSQRGGALVQVRAEHAEYERDTEVCRLHAATADYRDAKATAGDAKVQFRPDGSAARLDAVNGFTLVTASDDHVEAPTGSMEFDERNQPRHGHLGGGVRMDSARPAANGVGGRQVHATAPTAELEFTPRGQLQRTHLERGVEIDSEELSGPVKGLLRESRKWSSPVADLEFRDAGHGQVEPATIHGTEGVIVTGENQSGKAAESPSRLAADEVTGQFGPHSQLSAMTGAGHASMDETTAAGIRQTAIGDWLEVHFAPRETAGAMSGPAGERQIKSAVLEGHVVLTQAPQAKPDAPLETPMRATAGRAVYEGGGEWLHLTLSPRVEDGGLQLTAERLDVSRESGDAIAHGDVKATWTGSDSGKAGAGGSGADKAGPLSAGWGGHGPAHVIASEAQLHQATGEATFRGHARLWQEANSIAGPVIVLDRQKQTLAARSRNADEPVWAVLVSAGRPDQDTAARKEAEKDSGRDLAATSAAPSVIRVRGGDLKYSGGERKAWMRGGALGTVVAETATATSVSNEVELTLLPPGNHAGKDGGQAQVDRMTAHGRVVVTSGGRRGTGEQLMYTGETGEYVLTGTAATPPRMTDPARGMVTGQALIFHSRDDSVSIEGGERKTTTETTAPR
jgi:lipopolysaccharide export system protein LptA